MAGTAAQGDAPDEPAGNLLERVGKTLIVFASIAFVTLIMFAVLVVASYVEPYYSVPDIVESLTPVVVLAIVALIAGTLALVAAKVTEPDGD